MFLDSLCALFSVSIFVLFNAHALPSDGLGEKQSQHIQSPSSDSGLSSFHSLDSQTVRKENQGLPILNIPFDKKWRVMKYKKNIPTEFSVRNNILQIKSNNAVAFYHYKIPFSSHFSNCEWSLSLDWRVLEAKNMTSQKTNMGDDRPLAIHIWLNDPAQYGWFKGGLASLFSLPTPGDMLTYSWGVKEELAQHFPNPHLPERAHIFVLRSEQNIGEQWYQEHIAVSKDIDTLLGKKVGKKGFYLAVSADTEDSLGEALAEIKNIKIVTDQCEEVLK